MPSIKCDFYEVAVPSVANMTFFNLLERVQKSPNDATRTASHYDGTLIRLQQVMQISGTDLIYGEMLRIRMQHGPLRANKTGQVSPFNLNPDEGFGEGTRFIYHEETKTLVVHKTTTGVSPGALVDYVGQQCSTPGVYVLERMNLEPLKKLQRMRNLRKLNVAIASVNNAEILTGGIGGVFRSINSTGSHPSAITLAPAGP